MTHNFYRSIELIFQDRVFAKITLMLFILSLFACINVVYVKSKALLVSKTIMHFFFPGIVKEYQF